MTGSYLQASGPLDNKTQSQAELPMWPLAESLWVASLAGAQLGPGATHQSRWPLQVAALTQVRLVLLLEKGEGVVVKGHLYMRNITGARNICLQVFYA